MQLFRVFIFFIFVFVFSSTAVAAEEGSTPKDLFRLDDVVEISAPVSGDLYAVGREVILRGPVAGDILAAGRKVIVRGAVRGNVRIVGDAVSIESAVQGNVSVAARTLTLAPGASIEKNIVFYGQWFDLGGTVKGNVQLRMVAPAESQIRKNAVIDGRVVVYAPVAPIVEEGALLRQPLEYTVPEIAKASFGDFIFSRTISFFSLFFVGLVLVHLLRRPSFIIASFIVKKPLPQLFAGLVVAILPPLLAILLALTIIGIPLAVIISAFWAFLLYGARVFAGLALGIFLLARLDRQHRVQSLVITLCIGLFLLAVLESLPFIGFIITVAATLLALGGIVTLIRTLMEAQPKS